MSRLAKSLLAEAGYPGGAGFPEVELAVKTDDENKDKNCRNGPSHAQRKPWG